MEMKAELSEFKDMHGNHWTATLLMDGPEPRIQLRSLKLPPAIYNLATFLTIGERQRAFHVTGGELDDPVYFIDAKQAGRVAAEALAKIPGSVGRFVIKWEPHDPRVPF